MKALNLLLILLYGSSKIILGLRYSLLLLLYKSELALLADDIPALDTMIICYI